MTHSNRDAPIINDVAFLEHRKALEYVRDCVRNSWLTTAEYFHTGTLEKSLGVLFREQKRLEGARCSYIIKKKLTKQNCAENPNVQYIDICNARVQSEIDKLIDEIDRLALVSKRKELTMRTNNSEQDKQNIDKMSNPLANLSEKDNNQTQHPTSDSCNIDGSSCGTSEGNRETIADDKLGSDVEISVSRAAEILGVMRGTLLRWKIQGKNLEIFRKTAPGAPTRCINERVLALLKARTELAAARMTPTEAARCIGMTYGQFAYARARGGTDELLAPTPPPKGSAAVYDAAKVRLLAAEIKKNKRSTMTAQEAADFLGVGRNTLRNWGKQDKYPQLLSPASPLIQHQLYKKSQVVLLKRNRLHAV